MIKNQIKGRIMKNLIVYFSWSNNTKNLIETINKQFGFDVVRIERKKPLMFWKILESYFKIKKVPILGTLVGLSGDRQ